jgi:two-component system, LuxR family, response regulator FixJ
MSGTQMVHIVDDDDAVRDSMKASLESAGYSCMTYASPGSFLNGVESIAPGCVLLDVRMPQMDGLTVLSELAARKCELPVIIMTGFADVPMAVKAMKAGAVDFVEKPCPREELMDAVGRALSKAQTAQARESEKQSARDRLDRLTPREHEVAMYLVAGNSNKDVARKLGISPRTVEIHRGRLMEKTGVRSLAELVRLALAAEGSQNAQ